MTTIRDNDPPSISSFMISNNESTATESFHLPSMKSAVDSNRESSPPLTAGLGDVKGERGIGDPTHDHQKTTTDSVAVAVSASSATVNKMEYNMVDAIIMTDAATSVDNDTNRKRKSDKYPLFDLTPPAAPTIDGEPDCPAETALPTVNPGTRNPPEGTADHGGSVKRVRSGKARVSWEERMTSLAAYKAEHGDLNIPIRYKLNPSLGKFVHNTREQYKLFHGRVKQDYQKTCSLTAERIADLDTLGFLWTTERIKRQNMDWNSRLEQLKEYKVKHGHCLVAHGYRADPSFAEWIHRQRTSYASMLKAKDPNPLVKDRMDKLAEMGFNFTVHTDKWMEHWNLLKEYKEKHGNCQVPTHFDDNPRLGRWTHTQRHQRRLLARGLKSSMTQERIDSLDELGFIWEVRPAMEQPRATWQQRLDELKRFYLENGHFLIPSETHPKLHIWSHEQRSRLLNMHLSGKDASRRMGHDRVLTLEGVGFSKDTPLMDICSVMPGVVGDDDLLAPVLEHFTMDAAAAVEDDDDGLDVIDSPDNVAAEDAVDILVMTATDTLPSTGAVMDGRAAHTMDPSVASFNGAFMVDVTTGNSDIGQTLSGSASSIEREDMDCIEV